MPRTCRGKPLPLVALSPNRAYVHSNTYSSLPPPAGRQFRFEPRRPSQPHSGSESCKHCANVTAVCVAARCHNVKSARRGIKQLRLVAPPCCPGQRVQIAAARPNIPFKFQKNTGSTRLPTQPCAAGCSTRATRAGNERCTCRTLADPWNRRCARPRANFLTPASAYIRRIRTHR